MKSDKRDKLVVSGMARALNSYVCGCIIAGNNPDWEVVVRAVIKTWKEYESRSKETQEEKETIDLMLADLRDGGNK